MAAIVPTSSGSVACDLESQRGPEPHYYVPGAYYMINEEL